MADYMVEGRAYRWANARIEELEAERDTLARQLEAVREAVASDEFNEFMAEEVRQRLLSLLEGESK